MLKQDKPVIKQADVSAEDILSHLTSRQHLRPHTPVREIVDQTTELLGCCPLAIARAMDWLKIDPDKAIGRLRRSELVQLAMAVHRFWMQGAASSASR
jgi:hypothetical protein